MDQGRIVKLITPDEIYARHSEGAFLRLQNGSILFAYSRFTGAKNDDAHSEIAFCVSSDEGETWSDIQTLLSPEEFGCDNIMSVSLMRMRNGDLGLFLIAKTTPRVNKIFLCRSSDDGKSFPVRTECLADMAQGYYVLNNDRVLRLKSGRLLMPLAYHRGDITSNGISHMDGRATAVFVISDDDGATWHEAHDTVSLPFTNTRTGLQEPGVIEKKDGSVWGYARTDMMYQYEMFSFDQGEHWTAAQPSAFTSPASPMKVAANDTGKLYAVFNPIPNYVGRETSKAGWGRIPLALRVSSDDGRSWSAPLIIENEEGHGYCYPAIFFTADGCMLLSYCSGGPDDGICLARTTIRKLTL